MKHSKEKIAKRFDKQFKHLNDSTDEGGYDAKSYVLEFIHQELTALLTVILAKKRMSDDGLAIHEMVSIENIKSVAKEFGL